ncbi:MAG: hypothetical protein ABL928_15570 [Sphingorhabdus sp.]
MTHDSPSHTEPAPADPDLKSTILDFTPVVLEWLRANGRSPLTQRHFIHVLSVMGSVGRVAMDAAVNGVTTLRVLRGGSVSVTDIPSIAPFPHLLRCDFSATFQR